MLSRNGIKLCVGQEVLTLQIPIVGQHQFVDAVVTKITDKMVYVEYNHKDRWGSNGVREFKRYPEQLIVI